MFFDPDVPMAGRKVHPGQGGRGTRCALGGNVDGLMFPAAFWLWAILFNRPDVL